MAVSISIAIAQNSQSIANNTSNVTVTVKASWTNGSHNALVNAEGTPQAKGWVKIDGTTYNFASTFNTGKTSSGSQTIFTKTLNVSHTPTGTKTLACSASYATGVSSGTVTASASKTLTTIPRKSTLTVLNGTLGTALKLTVTKQADSFTHTITYACGSASGTICTKSSNTSITWTPPLSLANQNTTGVSVSIKFTITTYSGSSNVGSNTKTITCSIPASVKPSCVLTVTDPTGISDTYGGFVKGLSKFKVVVTPTTSYGSDIKAYKTTANGSTYTSASFTTGVLTSSGTLKVSSTVTDKRGRSGSASQSISVTNYSVPIISKLTVNRCTEDGTPDGQGAYVKVVFSANVTSLNNLNTASYLLRYKPCIEDIFTDVYLYDYTDSYSVADGTYIFPADTASSYNIEFSVTDSHNTSSRTTTASTGFTLMHWGIGGDSMAIGKVSELPGVLDLGLQTRFYGGILHPVLEPETDLNDIRTPNTYVGANISNYNYANCPLTSGTFTLEVVGMGEDGQVKQRLTYCHKTASRVWERIYYSSSWGEWVCVSDFDGTLLWSDAWYMHDTQTATLSESVSKQRTGIVLVFSLYDKDNSAAKNQEFFEFFVSKYTIAAHSGCGRNFNLCGMFGNGMKYLYLHDDKIVGHSKNNTTVTVGNVTYDNSRYVLRYVIGV